VSQGKGEHRWPSDKGRGGDIERRVHEANLYPQRVEREKKKRQRGKRLKNSQPEEEEKKTDQALFSQGVLSPAQARSVSRGSRQKEKKTGGTKMKKKTLSS